MIPLLPRVPAESVPPDPRRWGWLPGMLLLLASCKALTRPDGVPAELKAGQVPLALEAVRAELQQGQVQEAFFRSKAAREVEDLPADLRVEAESLFERATIALIDLHSSPEGDSEVLEELLEFEGVRVPLAVRAGVRAARLLYDQEAERSDAFRLIKKVDEKFPHHQERVAAGDLLAEIGFSFAQDDRSYGFFFEYRDHATPVLEYLVLNYPNQDQCDQAYFTLAQLYEESKLWSLAINRHEDLVLWHPTSPLVTASRARIPHLRLQSQASPEYDRHEIELALEETEVWLSRFSDPELEESVREDRLDALQRLADNDLIVARFYLRVENRSGAERHARRAVDAARAAGIEPQVQESEQLLARIVAELPELPTDGEVPVLPDPTPIDVEGESVTYPVQDGA